MAAMDHLSIADTIRKAKEFAKEYIGAVGVGLVYAFIMTYAFLYTLREPLSYPTLYIQDVYVPALNKTTTFNASVFIDLKFERAEAYFSCPFYTKLQINLFYSDHRGMPVAHHEVEGFSLGRRTEFHVEAAMEAPTLPWEEASRAVSTGLEVVLMVELMVTRGSDSCSLSPPMNLGMEVYAADVAVDASGHKVSDKPIQLYYKGELSYH